MGEQETQERQETREEREPVAGQDPRVMDRAWLETCRRAELRQAVWEASQFMSLEAIADYVQGVLREIYTDEP